MLDQILRKLWLKVVAGCVVALAGLALWLIGAMLTTICQSAKF